MKLRFRSSQMSVVVMVSLHCWCERCRRGGQVTVHSLFAERQQLATHTYAFAGLSKPIMLLLMYDKNRPLYKPTRELPGLVNISNRQIFTGSGNTFTYSEMSK